MRGVCALAHCAQPVQQRANVEIGLLMFYWSDLEGISIESMLMGANDAVKNQLRRAG